MLNNNYLALLITFAVSLIWLRINNLMAHRGWISGHISRKIIHIGTGPLYVACWLLFNDASISRYLAALVPLIITAQFILVGTGIIQDESAIQAMSRSGNRREILRGPLYYGLIFVIVTILYWRDTPIGMISLMLMCGGDGLADILGRRYGRQSLSWAKEKTWVGSAGMFMGGWTFAVGILAIYISFNIFPGTVIDYISAVTLIAFVGTLVESLPIKDVDNITVTMVGLGLGHILI